MKHLIFVLLLAPNAALAHTGEHGLAFVAGLWHPVSGLDHLLAMIAVGLLAGVTGARATWAMPLTFLSALLAGGVMGAYGLPLPAVEPMILSSIILLGALITLQARPTLGTILPFVALFGMAHGYAHGVEGPVSGLLPYAAAFTLTTAALHLAGLGLGLGLRGIPARTLGAGTAAAGLVLAFA